jgi:glucosamine--fructose-6-phosphate aminotransferase (isomerizing)
MNKFLQEIEEQPKALADTLRYYIEGHGKISLSYIVSLWQSGKYEKIIFTGMGSSYFISYAATCLLNRRGVTSFVINAGELLHYQFSLLNSKTLLVCISQSGESYEIVRILEKIPRGITVIGISNEAESTLIKKAQASLLCKAGKEEMTSTKTFISTYLVVYLLSLAFDEKVNEQSISEIGDVIKVIQELLDNRNEWLRNALDTISHTNFVQLVGRGTVFASVKQSALMCMEAARNPAAGLLSGEFRHGPFEMVKEGFRAVVFDPSGNTHYQNISLTKDILKFGGKVLLITHQAPSIEHNNLVSIVIPCNNEELFAIPSIVPMQLIINQWSIEDGNNPGDFMRGAKVTVIE